MGCHEWIITGIETCAGSSWPFCLSSSNDLVCGLILNFCVCLREWCDCNSCCCWQWLPFFSVIIERCSESLHWVIPIRCGLNDGKLRICLSAINCFYFLTVELSNARINRFSDGFFPSTSRLWNSLPSSAFPASFNLPSFKRQVCHHLRDQMTWFFLLPFLDIL